MQLQKFPGQISCIIMALFWLVLSKKWLLIYENIPVLLGGLERFLRLLQTAKMTKTQSSIRNMTARRTPEIMPIFWVRALSMGRMSLSTFSFSTAEFSYKTVRPSFETWNIEKIKLKLIVLDRVKIRVVQWCV